MTQDFEGRSFDELVDVGELSPDERARLESVHALLVAAGPPPDLPAALREPPAPAELDVPPLDEKPLVDENVVPLPSRPPRGRGPAWALIAAAVALALACLGGGYALGDHFGASTNEVIRVVPLEGSGARAEVSLNGVQPGGNWPMELKVTGLPKQSSDRAYYELFVWRHGKPGFPCVGFKMAHGTTTVHFTVPYELREGTELVVTAIEPGKASWPGKVVMRNA
jgi:hypothetical protein